MQKTLSQWIAHIESIHHSAIDLGLSRVAQVAAHLEVTNFDCPVITIAGTNGKGSCVACLESIYCAAGYKVGAYTSPNLLCFNERIRFNQQLIDDESLVDAFETVEAARRQFGLSLSFFEFTTLAALLIFKDASLDVIVLEVGLGGRLDAVNVVEPDVSIVTSIAMDHMDWLGNTRESIAFEKMGIARKGKPLVFGELDEPDNLLELIEKYQPSFHQINHAFQYRILNDIIEWRSGSHKVNAEIPGFIKPQNIASALMAITCLQVKLPVNTKQIQRGLASVNLPGRFEVISQSPAVVLDVAHNAAATEWLVQQFSKSFDGYEFIAVFGAMKDKAFDAMVLPLLPHINAWYTTDLPLKRAQTAQVLTNDLSALGAKNCYTFSTVSAAFDAALAASGKKTCVLVFGSFHTVAGVKKYIAKRKDFLWS